jgi:hypothetical protein
MDLTVAFTAKNATSSLLTGIQSAGDHPLLILQNNCIPGHNSEVREALRGRERCDIRELDTSHPLAQLWNLAVHIPQTPWVVIANDDVRFESGWEDKLEAEIEKYPACLEVNLAYPASSFSAFAIHKKLIGEIGWFDPAFPTFRWEDEDWYLRICEHYGADFAVLQHAKRIPDDSPIRWVEGVRNDPRQRDADRKRWGSLYWDLDPRKNEDYFWRKWAHVAKGGVLTKGPVRSGKKARVQRILETPDASRHQLSIGTMVREYYREMER